MRFHICVLSPRVLTSVVNVSEEGRPAQRIFSLFKKNLDTTHKLGSNAAHAATQACQSELSGDFRMSTLPQKLKHFCFSIGASSALPLLDPNRLMIIPIEELPPSDLGGILIIDLGISDGQADMRKLTQLAHYAELRRDSEVDEQIVALAIVGRSNIFQHNPEMIVWLRPDGVWPQWLSANDAQTAVDALWAKVRRERRSDRDQNRRRSEEKESHAQKRVRDLLDDLGYAYFMCHPDGSTLLSSRREKDLLEIHHHTDQVLQKVKGEGWWVYPEKRRDWLEQVKAKGVLNEYPALLRTYANHHRWVTIDCRYSQDPDGQPVLEGIYQDATQLNFTKRLSTALASVGNASGGVRETLQTVCHAAAFLFEVEGAALMCRSVWEGHEDRLFPMHIWCNNDGAVPSSRAYDSAGPRSRATMLVITLSAAAWIRALDEIKPTKISGNYIRPSLRLLFPSLLDPPDDVFVLPLPQSPEAEQHSPAQGLQAYLWIPVTQKLTFEPENQWESIQSFLWLCMHQLLLAANRDAFVLLHQVLTPFVNFAPNSLPAGRLAGFMELSEALEGARKALEGQMSIEGCSIFHTGIEDRKQILQMATTSGLVQSTSNPPPSYELGEGLLGMVARAQKPRLSFDISDEPAAKHKYVERTQHRRQTWLAVPLLSREPTPRTLGMIRCVNRTLEIGTTQHVTGFSALDLHVLVEFGRACALLIELAQLQEAQRRTLSRVTHELRSPAAGLRNNILYFKQHFGSQEPHMLHKLHTILDDLDLDVHVLINLLAQVDLLRGKEPTALREPASEISVRDMVFKTLNQLTPELRARDLPRNNIQIHVPDLPQFRLPRAAFAQVIFNLFVNTIKYSTSKDFRVVIYGRWASKELGRYEVGLKDWGIGVDDKYRDRIFEAELRTPQARKHDPTGLGLGLAISRKIMRELGGDLLLASCKNPTEFVIHIPAARVVNEKKVME